MQARLRLHGIAADTAPMLIRTARAGAIRDAVDPLPAALLFTSAAAVDAMAGDAGWADLRERPVHAVGPATAAAARRAGFASVHDSAGDAEALVAAVTVAVPPPGPLVWIAGHARSGAIDERLREAGYDVRVVEAYDAEPVQAFQDSVARGLAEGAYDVAVLASRRTAEAFVAALRAAGLPPPPVAMVISAAAGEPLAALDCRIVVAARPDGEALTDGVVALASPLPDNGRQARAPTRPATASGADGMAETDEKNPHHPVRRKTRAQTIDLPAADITAADAASVTEPGDAGPQAPADALQPAESSAESGSTAADGRATGQEGGTGRAAAAAPAPAAGRTSGFVAGGLAGALAGGLVAALVGWALAPGAPGVEIAAVAGLEQRLAALEGRASTDALAARVTSAETAVADLARALEAASAAPVEDGQARAGLADLATSVAALKAAVDGLAASAGASGDPAAADLLAGRIAAMDDALADVGTAVAGLSASKADGQALADLEGRLLALESAVASAATGPATPASAMALSALSARLDAGGPFAAELAMVAAAVPDLAGLQELTAVAADGVPTRAALLADLPVEAVLATRPLPVADGVVDQLVEGAKSLVNYRETAAGSDDPVFAALARAQSALADGDLAAARTELASVPSHATPVLTGYLAALDRRIAAEAALSDLTARLSGQLAAPTP